MQRDTELLIEGYPRSGNSFVEAAFLCAQPSKVRLAHHCHAAAQVLLGAKWRVPTLVIIRDPLEAACSLIMHHPDIFTPETALQEYLVFYRAIFPVRDKFVLADFKQVTTDLGVAIKAVNQKYDTGFGVFEHNEANVAKAYALLEDISRTRGTASADGEPYSPAKSEQEKLERAREKQRIREAFDPPLVQSLLAEARTLYTRFLDTIKD